MFGLGACALHRRPPTAPPDRISTRESALRPWEQGAHPSRLCRSGGSRLFYAHGLRLRALIVVLWRAGLRIGEAMALTEPDLDPGRGSLLIRQGKGGKRREVGMDDWGFQQLRPWLTRRLEMPVGTLFCVIDGQTRGRPWAPAAARNHLRRIATKAGGRRRFAPHQLRHAHAVETAHERVPLNVIQRQLGHHVGDPVKWCAAGSLGGWRRLALLLAGGRS
jgi:integrase